ncbi:hypothetical protein H9X57_13945 [Flavobacterium piscinae]|uniref:ParA family protein n=1 Tax=Flavobacterium piscinae TaxID=2506424 RepID=A0A4Q1KX15_9FLAO|nr:hypothetical protein [Flavobacterium piscinae]MBC8884028.1 hypothetical protein [Flavobacterium piscinae]RXR34858.1 hypothetical protein EQG68_02815 [Flavobacterium piscinae]
MKTILAIWNASSKGKSSTILEIAKHLLIQFPNHNIIFCDKDVNNLTVDFRLVIEINGKIIVLESQGDPGTRLEARLTGIVNQYNPDLIFCTCRTRGETVNSVENTANNFEYLTIWSSTYQTTHNHSTVNQVKAEHLLDLIKKLGLI